MYNWKITTRTQNYLSREHGSMLQRMIDRLCIAYDECDHRQEFYMVNFLLGSFRDIIMAWGTVEFSLAYDELSEWQKAFMEGR